MEDMLLLKECKSCGGNITLMGSCRMSPNKNGGEFLVERCLNCGQRPVTEVARLHDDQSDLIQFTTPIANYTWKKEKI